MLLFLRFFPLFFSMKSPALFLSILSIFAASQAGAVVVLGPVSNNYSAGTLSNLGTVTNAQVAGYSQLIITYSVTNAADSNTAWFGLGINSSDTSSTTNVMTASTNFAALLRTTMTSGSHQTFATGGTTGSTPSAAFTSAGASVRIIIDITNGFTGSSAYTFSIDEGSTTFTNADKNLSGTMNWTAPQAVFTGSSYTVAHNLSNFTVQAVPEPGSFALAALGGLALLRRKRA